MSSGWWEGAGNPHREEGELLYFIDQGVVEGKNFVVPTTTKEGDGYEIGVNDDLNGVEVLSINIVVNFTLEHLW